MTRRVTIAAIGLLLVSILVLGTSTSGSTSTSGALTGWTGNAMQGASYTMLQLDSNQNVTSLTIQFVGTAQSATAYCGVDASNPHYPPTAQDQYAWSPRWGFSAAQAQGTATINPACTTTTLLVAVKGGASPALSIPGGATSTPSATVIPATNTPIPATVTPTSAATATSTSVSATNTPVLPTATSTPASTPTATGTPFPVNQCHDVGDGAVDQNGVSVDVWAPGLRIACGFPGYENGDNPMPPGTPLPPPRPFRFDSAVDHNEGVFGFKVFYRASGDPRGCGDVRAILHQGEAAEGRFVQFHTFQFATAFCDAEGLHIIDVGGQTDSGGVMDQFADNGTRPTKFMGTRDDYVSRGKLFDIYYNFFRIDEPGGPGYPAFVHQGFATETDAIAVYWDPADPHHVQFVCRDINGRDDFSCGHDNSTHALRDLQYQLFQPAAGQTTWWSFFDATRGTNTVVPAGTPGAWQQRVDKGIGPVYENGGVSHSNRVAGLAYPN